MLKISELNRRILTLKVEKEQDSCGTEITNFSPVKISTKYSQGACTETLENKKIVTSPKAMSSGSGECLNAILHNYSLFL